MCEDGTPNVIRFISAYLPLMKEVIVLRHIFWDAHSGVPTAAGN